MRYVTEYSSLDVTGVTSSALIFNADVTHVHSGGGGPIMCTDPPLRVNGVTISFGGTEVDPRPPKTVQKLSAIYQIALKQKKCNTY